MFDRCQKWRQVQYNLFCAKYIFFVLLVLNFTFNMQCESIILIIMTNFVKFKVMDLGRCNLFYSNVIFTFRSIFFYPHKH